MELSTSISPGFPLLEKDQKITGFEQFILNHHKNNSYLKTSFI